MQIGPRFNRVLPVLLSKSRLSSFHAGFASSADRGPAGAQSQPTSHFVSVSKPIHGPRRRTPTPYLSANFLATCSWGITDEEWYPWFAHFTPTHERRVTLGTRLVVSNRTRENGARHTQPRHSMGMLIVSQPVEGLENVNSSLNSSGRQNHSLNACTVHQVMCY